ncbi:Magnesium and cobalt efflux protein CorC [Lachnospiraceae bacterium TWA4]|nr:Magnesium and cobalt efflux protein CorC [Lachnospiraceae bacterium TWA4]
MDTGDLIQLVVLFVLLAASAFFSSAETALSTVNRIRIHSLADEGNKKAITLTKVIDDQAKMLSVILIGNNIINISASSLATILATKLLGSMGAGVATGTLTLLVLIFGEITPKTLASFHAEKISLSYARIIYALMTVLTPIVFIVNVLSHGILRLLRVSTTVKDSAYTENELRVIMEASHEEGILEEEEHQMINNVFDFDSSCAKDIMVPRIDMTSVNVDATYEELIELFRKDMFTRLPVYEETTDNIIGIMNMKDLLLCEDSKENFSIRTHMREAFYSHEFKNTSELFIEMKKASAPMAIILDEYGATAGLVTLEDLIEEIVGEIRDEYDADELNSIKKISDTEYVIEASTKLDDINDALGTEFESEDYDSLGGLLIGIVDRLPEQGEVIEDSGYRFEVLSVDKNRIEKVRVNRIEVEKEAEE